MHCSSILPAELYSVHLFSGAVVLQSTCFSEAERLFMLVKDTVVNDKQLTAVVLPEVMVKPCFILMYLFVK